VNTSKVPLLGEGFQETTRTPASKSTDSSDAEEEVDEKDAKLGKRRLFGFGKKKEDDKTKGKKKNDLTPIRRHQSHSPSHVGFHFKAPLLRDHTLTILPLHPNGIYTPPLPVSSPLLDRRYLSVMCRTIHSLDPTLPQFLHIFRLRTTFRQF
jgi:hypothetical protein